MGSMRLPRGCGLAPRGRSPPSLWRLVLLVLGVTARRTCQPIAAQPGSPHERFLYYTKDSGWCTGTGHTIYSHVCMAAEARFLNRTLIYDDRFCNVFEHSLQKGEYWDVEPGENYEDRLANHFNVSRLEQLPAISKDTWLFGAECSAVATAPSSARYGTLEMRVPWRVPTAQLTSEPYVNALVLVRNGWYRQNRRKSHLGYWYEVCTRNPIISRKGIEAYFTPPDTIREVARHVLRKLEPNYTAVHVRRGDKAARKNCWPNVDRDTQPSAIAASLQRLGVPDNSTIYVASNELAPGFFHRPPLGTRFRVFTSADFPTEFRRVASANHAIAAVETYLVNSAARRFETFNDLTQDVRMKTGC